MASTFKFAFVKETGHTVLNKRTFEGPETEYEEILSTDSIAELENYVVEIKYCIDKMKDYQKDKRAVRITDLEREIRNKQIELDRLKNEQDKALGVVDGSVKELRDRAQLPKDLNKDYYHVRKDFDNTSENIKCK